MELIDVVKESLIGYCTPSHATYTGFKRFFYLKVATVAFLRFNKSRLGREFDRNKDTAVLVWNTVSSVPFSISRFTYEWVVVEWSRKHPLYWSSSVKVLSTICTPSLILSWVPRYLVYPKLCTPAVLYRQSSGDSCYFLSITVNTFLLEGTLR